MIFNFLSTYKNFLIFLQKAFASFFINVIVKPYNFITQTKLFLTNKGKIKACLKTAFWELYIFICRKFLLNKEGVVWVTMTK